jgi:hypothetical protein
MKEKQLNSSSFQRNKLLILLKVFILFEIVCQFNEFGELETGAGIFQQMSITKTVFHTISYRII